jgi:hypothetical protein
MPAFPKLWSSGSARVVLLDWTLVQKKDRKNKINVNCVSHTVVENLKQFAFKADKSRVVRRTFWLIKVVPTWKKFGKRWSMLSRSHTRTHINTMHIFLWQMHKNLVRNIQCSEWSGKILCRVHMKTLQQTYHHSTKPAWHEHFKGGRTSLFTNGNTVHVHIARENCLHCSVRHINNCSNLSPAPFSKL